MDGGLGRRGGKSSVLGVALVIMTRALRARVEAKRSARRERSGTEGSQDGILRAVRVSFDAKGSRRTTRKLQDYLLGRRHAPAPAVSPSRRVRRHIADGTSSTIPR